MQVIQFFTDNPSPSVPLFERIENVIQLLLTFIKSKHSLVSTCSGGKDSSLTTLLVIEAIRRAQEAGIDQAPHFISVGDTTVENPSILFHLHAFLEEIEQYSAANNLPLSVHIVQPSLAAQFVVSTIGRGTLARTNENSVKNGQRSRSCSDSWKVQPQVREQKRLAAEVRRQGFNESITVLGTRFSESSVRASNMTRRGENETRPVRSKDGNLTLSPIANFSTDDVWEVLGHFTDENLFPFPSPVSTTSILRMHELYRSANEGVCGVVLGDGGNRGACGARHGCAVCLVAGEKDKSLEAMTQEPKHAHLAGINDIRNYLMSTQWDMSKREMIGRTVSSAGYLRIQPDVYSYEHRLELLRYFLTLDAIEIERAERHADDLALGVIPDTPDNRDLVDVQFQMISPSQLVAIDFYLSMHPYAAHAFPALSVWYDVHTLGRRYAIPKIDAPVPKTTLPKYGWYKVGKFNVAVPTDGLRDYTAELWNRHRHPNRVSTYSQTPDGTRICYFEESDQLTVDAMEACAFITCVFDRMAIEVRQFPAIHSARFWLNEAILKLPKSQAQKYQEMAVRGQYFANLSERFNLTPMEMDAYLQKNSISDPEHDRLVNDMAYPLFANLEVEVTSALLI